MENDKITIDVQITPKKAVEYITLDFTINPTSLNIKRQKKINSILSEIHI
jgi:hypothetical protein